MPPICCSAHADFQAYLHTQTLLELSISDMTVQLCAVIILSSVIKEGFDQHPSPPADAADALCDVTYQAFLFMAKIPDDVGKADVK